MNEVVKSKNSKSSEDIHKDCISSDVAVSIAKGHIAASGLDLNLYRPEVMPDGEDYWNVEFILKERYRYFNVLCPVLQLSRRTGEIVMQSYPKNENEPLMEHATKSRPSSLPYGSIGIYVGDERRSLFEIRPWEWEALFWDELGATDPNFSPDWEKRFADSIPEYPKLSRIHGLAGSLVTFEATELDALIVESARIAASAKNPLALDVVKRILTACELARKSHSSVRFVGD